MLIGLLMLIGSSSCAAAAAPDACTYLATQVSHYGAGPLWLASYPDAARGPLDQTAFTYDNAVATIALVACGDTAAATRIGEAMLLALDHDRHWTDGRLRNAYFAGPVGGKPIKLPGWWDASSRRWLEDGYQVGSDSGNMAWAMLALLTLDGVNGDHRFRAGAVRIGQWVAASEAEGTPPGFTGGSFGEETAAKTLLWRSTEHNTDLAAAFGWLYRDTGDGQWQRRALVAAHFVARMWDAQCNCFAVGVGEDGVTPNPLLALDAQVWPLLALPGAASRYAAVLSTVARRLAVPGGLRYSEPATGLWTEGSAQAAVLLQLMNKREWSQQLLGALQTQRTANGGYYASDVAAASTGFMLDTDPTKPRQYFHLEHLGAAAWAALAQQRFNPFTGTRQLPP